MLLVESVRLDLDQPASFFNAQTKNIPQILDPVIKSISVSPLSRYLDYSLSLSFKRSSDSLELLKALLHYFLSLARYHSLGTKSKSATHWTMI